jgi:hypothetical protein
MAPTHPKSPRDLSQVAKPVVDVVTGQVEDRGPDAMRFIAAIVGILSVPIYFCIFLSPFYRLYGNPGDDTLAWMWIIGAPVVVAFLLFSLFFSVVGALLNYKLFVKLFLRSSNRAGDRNMRLLTCLGILPKTPLPPRRPFSEAPPAD